MHHKATGTSGNALNTRREAQNAREQFFGKDRLLASAKAGVGRPAQDIQEAILADLYEFMGDAPQPDNIALVVVLPDSQRREKSSQRTEVG